MPNRSSDSPTWTLLVFLILGVILVLVVGTAAIWGVFGRPQDAGQFGDLFGGLNALFSGLAFAGVIYAILLQRRELELQRQELQQTREEMERGRVEAARAAAAQLAGARLAALSALIEHMKGAIRETEGTLASTKSEIARRSVELVGVPVDHDRLKQLHVVEKLQEGALKEFGVLLDRYLADQRTTYESLTTDVPTSEGATPPTP
jgi:hypothetical protein